MIKIKIKIKIKIILCTYNGEKYILSQLNSIKKQNFSNWVLDIYDDCSSDNTVKIVHEFIKNNPKLNLNFYSNVDNKGYYKNFIDSLLNTKQNYELLCFSDQDDYWLPNKLDMILENYVSHNKPFFYFSRRYITNQDLKIIYVSPKKNDYPLTFRHVFFQNLAGGNTIALNNIFLNKFNKLKYPYLFSIHDWELLTVASALNGCNIIFDERPSLLYRQHPNAAVGEIFTLRKFKKDLIEIITFKRKKEINNRIIFFLKNKDFFTKDQLKFIKDIKEYRECNFFSRLLHIRKISFCKYRFNLFKRFIWYALIVIGIF